MAPLHALEELRSLHPRYVQSIAQERFLDQLAAWLRGPGSAPRDPGSR